MSTIVKESKRMKDKTKYKKLLEAHSNNILISNYNLKDKFTDFENSKLNESRTLLYEIKEKPLTFKRYSRGNIVKVKFGVNIGSEFSGDHYAIIISKRDTMYNPILHVIPITSDDSKYNINLGEIIYDEKQIKNLQELYDKKTNNNEKKEIKKCINYYSKNKNRKSFACTKHIKTISKLSILKPLNKYDYLPKLKLSDKILDKIDLEIIKEYTNFNYKK